MEKSGGEFSDRICPRATVEGNVLGIFRMDSEGNVWGMSGENISGCN